MKTRGELPHDSAAEESVLGSVLVNNSTISHLVDIIEPADFYGAARRRIWGAIIELYRRGQPVDMVTLGNTLSLSGELDGVGGYTYLAALIDACPSTANVHRHAAILRAHGIVRAVLEACTDCISQGCAGVDDLDEYLTGVQRSIYAATIRYHGDASRMAEEAREIVPRVLSRIEALAASERHLTGLATGFSSLDGMTSGLQPGELVILAARPSMGKTALALQIAEQACRLTQGVRATIYSLEMDREALVLRSICRDAAVDSLQLRRGNVSPDEWRRITNSAMALSNETMMTIDDRARMVEQICSRERQVASESRPSSLVVVDYLQLLQARRTRAGASRNEIVGEQSAMLKSLARELRIPVMVLSQLNRGVESRQDHRPILADLRDSGSIEQDGDLIMFIYRDEVYNPETPDRGVAEIIIAKNRNGPIGTVRLRFSPRYTRFSE